MAGLTFPGVPLDLGARLARCLRAAADGDQQRATLILSSVDSHRAATSLE
jgi:hypothetical protein